MAVKISSCRSVITKPLLLAFILFAGLVSGGWVITKMLI